MANNKINDPVAVLQDLCAYAFAAKYMGSGSQVTSFDSGSVETLAYCGWTLLVCLAAACSTHRISNKKLLVLSWEFFTTLDYEWSVIRRHRRFRWTIWVRINVLFLLDFVAQIRGLD